jgi:hypothetical protein
MIARTLMARSLVARTLAARTLDQRLAPLRLVPLLRSHHATPVKAIQHASHTVGPCALASYNNPTHPTLCYNLLSQKFQLREI